MLCLYSGPLGFTVGFLLLPYSVVYCWVLIFVLSPFLISQFIFSRIWYIDNKGSFLRPKHLFVLIHIRNKGEVGTLKLVFTLTYFFYWPLHGGASFADPFIYLCLMFVVMLSCLVATCWERAILLALLNVMFSCVFITFQCGILGQVWYLIVWIPDCCLLIYFHVELMSNWFLTTLTLCTSFGLCTYTLKFTYR